MRLFKGWRHEKRVGYGSPRLSGAAAQGASNKDVNKVIESTGDLICEDVVISKEEIGELFTGFYERQKSGFYGHTVHRDFTPEDKAFLRSSRGLDRLPAQTFDSVIANNLKQDQGVVVNVTEAGPIWNQPVFRSDRCAQAIPPSRVSPTAVPVSLLQAKVPAVSKWLNRIVDNDKYVNDRFHERPMEEKDALELLGKERKVLDYKKASREIVKSLQDLKAGLDSTPQSPQLASLAKLALDEAQKHEEDYALNRELTAKLVDEIARRGQIGTKPNLKFEKVSNVLTYRVETSFGKSPGPNTKQLDFVYTLVKDQYGKVVDSYWGDWDTTGRPGFLWTPISLKQEQLTPQLKDLIKIINMCKNDPSFHKNNHDALLAITQKFAAFEILRKHSVECLALAQ